MKEEQNEPIDRCQPSEKEMNDMHQNAWLDFHADAQAEKQRLNRAYAITVSKYGSYKNIPYGVKELLKSNYNAHEAKWGENGEEMQKRFGIKETAPEITQDQQNKKQEFLQQLQQQRQQGRGVELER